MRTYNYAVPTQSSMNQYGLILKWLLKRIEKNKNIIIVVNGPTGSGKSWACIRVAEDCAVQTNTQFTIKNNLAFKFEETLKNMHKNEDIPGTCYILEEVGATQSGSSAREWQSKANILFNSFMQTNRCKRQILILNCPSFYNLDKGTRQLVHFQLESVAINYRSKVSIFKPFEVQTNSRTQKIYFKFLKYRDKINNLKRISRVNIRKPSNELIKEYESAKNRYVNGLNKHLLEKMEPKEVVLTSYKRREFENKIKTIPDLLEKGMKPPEIAKMLDISLQTVYNHRFHKD